MDKKNVILISGYKRSGKDYSADYLKTSLSNATSVSFAEPMKRIISATFGITPEVLEISKNDPELWKVDIRNSQSGEIMATTDFREILQRFGTEGMKPIFGDSVWAENTEGLISNLKEDFIIISDFRFLCEREAFDSFKYNITTIRILDSNIKSTDLHASETELRNFGFDYYIDNTAKDDTLLDALDQIMIKEKW